jgi:hypothetical protein
MVKGSCRTQPKTAALRDRDGAPAAAPPGGFDGFRGQGRGDLVGYGGASAGEPPPAPPGRIRRLLGVGLDSTSLALFVAVVDLVGEGVVVHYWGGSFRCVVAAEDGVGVDCSASGDGAGDSPLHALDGLEDAGEGPVTPDLGEGGELPAGCRPPRRVRSRGSGRRPGCSGGQGWLGCPGRRSWRGRCRLPATW